MLSRGSFGYLALKFNLQMSHNMQVKVADSEKQAEDCRLFIGMIPKTYGEDQVMVFDVLALMAASCTVQPIWCR